jgi:redox-sensitive bicupin YhaK (pirin superfamily)
MEYIRKANDRGHAQFSWLDSHHTFSFGGYYDPAHMGFSTLRVINDDTVKPGAGFETHGHANMEIVSYITHGTIAHQDSTGNQYTIPAGELQRMTAGRGIEHSEFNFSDSEPLKFLQIWIEPKERNIAASYEQKSIESKAGLQLVVSPNGDKHSLSINADVNIFRLQLDKGEGHKLNREANRWGYLHIIDGNMTINQEDFSAGDGIGVVSTESLNITADEKVVALWFDLPPIPQP